MYNARMSTGSDILGLQLAGRQIQRLNPNSSQEEQMTVINAMVDRLNEMLRTQVFQDPNNKRMMIGYQADGWGEGKDFGIKISKEGYDVTEATDDQLLFKMDMETWTYYSAESVGKVLDVGTLADGKVGIDWFDPDDERNFARAGIQPDGTAAFVTAKDGESIQTIYEDE